MKMKIKWVEKINNDQFTHLREQYNKKWRRKKIWKRSLFRLSHTTYFKLYVENTAGTLSNGSFYLITAILIKPKIYTGIDFENGEKRRVWLSIKLLISVALSLSPSPSHSQSQSQSQSPSMFVLLYEDWN